MFAFDMIRKAELDVNFLRNCQSFGMFPKFINFNLLNVSPHDCQLVHKQLIRSAIRKRSKKLKKLQLEKEKLLSRIDGFLNRMDIYFLKRSLCTRPSKTIKRSYKI